MKDYLDGKTDPEEFSFNFPAALATATPELDNNNPGLSELLNEELPDVLCNFEPYEAERLSRPDIYYSEEQMRVVVQEVYDKAITLI